jgi:hypothetical protein
VRKHFLSLIGAATVAAAISLAAQQPPAPDPTGSNSANAATSPAGTGGNQRPPQVPAGPAPRLPDGSIDLTGVWQGGGPIGDLAQGLAPGETIPLLPEAKTIMDARMSGDDPEANCLPTGVPRVAPYPWRIVQVPPYKKATHLFFLFEGNIHSYRQIFMDGRKHPEDPDPTWYGHSIGRWEGDTLVIDTVGFNDKFWFDFRGHPHTEKLHTVERWTRKDLGTLVNEVTIEDPGSYSRPFTVRFTARLRPNDLSSGSYYGRRRPEDGRIDWTKSAQEIHNLVRAVAPPFPGAFHGSLKINKTKIETGKTPPAKVLGPYQDGNGEWFAACGDGKVLRLLEVQKEQ